jgi:hypothetical protein
MKTRILFSFSILLFLFGLNGCVTLQPFYYGTYDISMSEVERPAEAKERYGEQKITSTTEEGNLKYYFEDDLVKIAWLATSSSLSFVMENKTDHSIKIIWDEAAFVDDKGVSQRIMHSGVKYTDRNASQPPTIIVRKGRIEDIIVPTNNVYFDEGYYGKYYTRKAEWKEKPFFESLQYGGDPKAFENQMRNNVGKTFQVLLPLEIENVVNDYIFKFKVDSYEYKGEFKNE